MGGRRNMFSVVGGSIIFLHGLGKGKCPKGSAEYACGSGTGSRAGGYGAAYHFVRSDGGGCQH